MQAYVWHGPNTGPLRLSTLPIPTPSSGEVLLEVTACGLCHSDCHIINGHQADAVKLRPITMGHEVAGTILSTGPDVTGFRAGDRVAVWLGGHPDRPPRVIGLTMHGGYAEYAVAAADMLVAVPEGLPDELAAVTTDSLCTSYHAVVVAADARPGERVAVVGLGGLGMVGLQAACALGCEVYGFDLSADKRAAAAAGNAGVVSCHARLEDVAGEDRGLLFDKVVDFVGVDATMRAALRSVRYRGRVVIVGLEAPEVALPTFDIIWNKVQIYGSLGGSKEDMYAIMRLLAEGKLRPELEEIPFDGLNEGLRRLEANETSGRLYVRPGRGRKTSA